MTRTIRRALILAFCVALPVAPARASASDDFTAALPELPGKTWLDLLQPIFPDIAAPTKSGATAKELIDLQSIGVGDDSWINCGDDIRLTTAQVNLVRLAGQSRLIMTLSVADDCVALLALLDGEGKLIQAVNVKGDQHAGVGLDRRHPIGNGGALITVSNWHDNSNQSYDNTMLVLAKPEGFSVIGDVLAFGDRFCRRGTTETTTIHTRPTTPFALIEVEVSRSMRRIAKPSAVRPAFHASPATGAGTMKKAPTTHIQVGSTR
jgi:hypothetical protein